MGGRVHRAGRRRRPEGDRGSPVRVRRDPSRAGAGAHAGRGGTAGPRGARPGDDGARRVRDGAPDDPRDAGVRGDDRGGRARRAAGELHEPGGDRDAGVARSRRRASRGDLRRPDLDAAERRRAPGAPARARVRRLRGAQPLRLDPPRPGGRPGPAPRAAGPVRGPASARRPVAAVRPHARPVDRHAPDGVPVLLLLPRRGGREHPRLGGVAWPAAGGLERRALARAARARRCARSAGCPPGMGAGDGRARRDVLRA